MKNININGNILDYNFLGEKNFCVGQEIKDNRAGIVYEIFEIKDSGFDLKKQTSLQDDATVFISFDDLLAKFKSCEINVQFFEKNDSLIFEILVNIYKKSEILETYIYMGIKKEGILIYAQRFKNSDLNNNNLLNKMLDKSLYLNNYPVTITKEEYECFSILTEEKLLVKEKFLKGGSFLKNGYEVQSLIFLKDFFTLKESVEWAKNHKYNFNLLEEKNRSFRIRQEKISCFRKNSIKIITLAQGIIAVVANKKINE